MIQVCSKEDKAKVIDYIGNQYYKCLYLYLDFLKYGFSYNYVKTWLMLDNDRIVGVILKYKTGMHVFSHDNTFDINEFNDLVLSQHPDMICASKDTALLLIAKLEDSSYKLETGYVGMYSGSDSIDVGEALKARKRDFKEIVSLLYQDEGIGASYDKSILAQQLFERSRQRYSRNIVFKRDNHVVSHVCTGAENENLAVVSGLVTDGRYRGKGLASKLLQICCSELLNEGKKVYSIYYTQAAQHTHHKGGFVDVCEYGKLFLKKH